MVEPTVEMFKLGEAVFLEGVKKLKEYKEMDFLHNRGAMIIKKRLAVVEFVHGLELILKAVMIKKGFLIYTIENKGINRKDVRINELINKEKTIGLSDVISFFKKEYPDLPFDTVEKLRKLRNQIIHRGTEISEKKTEYFIGAIDSLTGLYNNENINHRKFLREIEEAKLQI